MTPNHAPLRHKLALYLSSRILAANDGREALCRALRGTALLLGARHAAGSLETPRRAALHASWGKPPAAQEERVPALRLHVALRDTALTGSLTITFDGCRRPLEKERAEQLLSALLPALFMRAKAEQAETADCLFQDIVQAAGDAILAVGEDRSILLFNNRAEECFGYKASEVLGKPLEMLLPPRMRSTHAALVNEFSAHDQNAKIMGRRPEVFGCRKDGSLFPADISIARSIIGGKPVLTAIARDLSRIRNTELALLSREMELKEIIERMPFGIAVARERDGIIILSNEAFAATAQRPAEDIQGRHASLFFEGLSPASLAFEPLWSQATFRGMEIDIKRPHDQPARSIVSTVRITHQNERAVLFGCNDVTDHIKTLENLRRSELKLTRAQHIARIGDWELDMDAQRLCWSDQARRIITAGRGDCDISAPALFLQHVHPDDREMVNTTFKEARETGEPISLTFKLTRTYAGGADRPLHVHLEGRIEAAKGKQNLRWVGTIQDITQQAEAQQELVETRNRALTASRIKSRFLANMSHELRTPLNAIIGFSELIARDEFNGDLNRYRGYAEDILQSGQHLLDLLNDVLDLSRVESGHIKLTEEWLSPEALVQSCLRMVRERASAAGLTLQSVVDPALPEILADQRLCKQVLLNLLVNAIKFTPPGKKLGIHAERGNEGGLVFTVWDEGIGIDPADLARVLEPFEQAENELRRQHDGVGLGLSLAKSLVELHSARFSMDSAPGQGTRVYIAFPPARCGTADISSERPFKALRVQAIH